MGQIPYSFRFLDRLRVRRLLGGLLRASPRQGDLRSVYREIHNLRESITTSLCRSAVVGFSVRSRMCQWHQKRVQAGTGLGIEVAAQVPPTGAFLTQPEFASGSFRAGVLGVTPVRIETREQVCPGDRDVARSRDAGKIDQDLLGVEPGVCGDVLGQPPHHLDDSIDAAIGQYAGGGRGSGQRRDGRSGSPVARASRVERECPTGHLLRLGPGDPGHMLVEDGDRVVSVELSDTS